MNRDLIYTGSDWKDNWFYNKYSIDFNGSVNHRYYTFQIAFNILQQTCQVPPVIVETGCQRELEDFGAGMSTTIFAEYVQEYGGYLSIIDNRQDHLDRARGFIEEFDIDVELIHQDSVEALHLYDRPINLLYLDSYDYPYVEMMQEWVEERILEFDPEEGYTDEQMARAHTALSACSRREILDRFSEMILPCQDHCVEEFLAAKDKLLPNSVLLIDDNNFPGGGKPALLKSRLENMGWICLMDYQQTLWVKKLESNNG